MSSQGAVLAALAAVVGVPFILQRFGGGGAENASTGAEAGEGAGPGLPGFDALGFGGLGGGGTQGLSQALGGVATGGLSGVQTTIKTSPEFEAEILRQNEEVNAALVAEAERQGDDAAKANTINTALTAGFLAATAGPLAVKGAKAAAPAVARVARAAPSAVRTVTASIRSTPPSTVGRLVGRTAGGAGAALVALDALASIDFKDGQKAGRAVERVTGSNIAGQQAAIGLTVLGNTAKSAQRQVTRAVKAATPDPIERRVVKAAKAVDRTIDNAAKSVSNFGRRTRNFVGSLFD